MLMLVFLLGEVGGLLRPHAAGRDARLLLISCLVEYDRESIG